MTNPNESKRDDKASDVIKELSAFLTQMQSGESESHTVVSTSGGHTLIGIESRCIKDGSRKLGGSA